MENIAQDNADCLRQGIALLGTIGDALYRSPSPQCFNSSIGGHMRHNIDHYLSFLEGYASGRVDYDARARDPRIENDAAYACEQMLTIVMGLGGVRGEDLDRALEVKMDCNSMTEGAQPWSMSSVRRELQFLLGHTIHHYALISTICRLQGHAPSADFGIAPSTLRYQRESG